VRDGHAPIPLLPRRRVHGTPLGDMRSGRRGDGAELVGLRTYRGGDDLRRIDQRASARASRARGEPVLLVREFLAEEAARVVLVLDASPSMQLFPPSLPWLRKPAAVREIVRLLLESAFDARSAVGCVRAGGDGDVTWWPPTRRPRIDDWTAAGAAPPGSLTQSLETLARLPRLGKGTFVFVVSDLLEPPGEEVWWRLLARGWDPVPVLVQDPTWEQSFPDVRGLVLPIADPVTGQRTPLRLTARQARERREANAGRLARLTERLRRLGFDPVLLGTTDPVAIDAEFLAWARRRRLMTRHVR
jgi:uncharacterized protein (DUF58 family)